MMTRGCMSLDILYDSGKTPFQVKFTSPSTSIDHRSIPLLFPARPSYTLLPERNCEAKG